MSKKTSEIKNRRPEREQKQRNQHACASDRTFAPAGSGPAVFVDNCEVPVRYGHTGITLIARDPSSVYAYWEISPASLREAKSRLGEGYKKSTPTLRMLDITGIDFDGSNARGQFDVALDPQAQSRYILLPNDNATLCADLGLKTTAGFFYPLARSNVIATPSANESDCLETTWMRVRHAQGSKPCVVARAFSESAEQCNVPQPGAVSPQTSDDEPDAAMISDPAAAAFATAGASADDAAAMLIPAPGREVARGTRKSGGSLRIARSPAETATNRIPFFEPQFAGASERILFPADMNRPTSFPAPGADHSASSPDIANVSSPAVGGSERPARGNDFFFHLDADLIVYGKAKPGAKVTLNERPLALEKDGSFSVRFALPDGMIGLDFQSQPPDGSEKKNISLTVGRSTTVHQ